jgi:hypothetical protein
MAHARAALDSASKLAAIVLALILGYGLFASQAPAGAQGQPANKVAAAADVDDIKFIEGGEKEPVLETSLRTSKPSELLLHVSAECALWTYVRTFGNDDQAARGELKLWLTKATNGGEPEVIGVTSVSDGPNSPGEAQDDGKVVFCDRMYRRTTNFADDEDHEIDTYMDTRSANAFNWLALNVGSGVHTITLWAEFDDTVNIGDFEAGSDGASDSTGAIGRRSLIIEPVRAAVDAQVVNDLNVD